MKLEDLKKTKEEYENQRIENNKQYLISDERTRMASINQMDNKIIISLALSMIPWFVITLTLLFLDQNMDLTLLINTITPYSIPAFTVISSATLGALGKNLMSNKYQTKERFSSFTKSKNEVDKLEEEVYYQIELEKAKNRNKIINKTIETLNHNESLLREVSKKYNINEKQQQNISLIQKKLEELLKIKTEKYNELDILTTQKVLHEKFWRIRSKNQRIIDFILATAGFGMLAMMMSSLSIITMKNAFSLVSLFQKNIMLFIPCITTSLATGIYWNKRNNNRKKVFNKFNNKLNEKAIPQEVNIPYDEERELKSLVENKINEITTLEIQLSENKRNLENLLQTKTKKEQLNDKTLDKIPLLTEEVNLYPQESPSLFDFQSIFEPEELELLQQIEKSYANKRTLKKHN